MHNGLFISMLNYVKAALEGFTAINILLLCKGMSIKQFILKTLAKKINRGIEKDAGNAMAHQKKIMLYLVQKSKNTQYGKLNNFENIHDYQSFKNLIPVTNYETLFPFIQKTMNGESHVLWPKKPAYIAKTSGTSGDFKYIPISKEAMPFHIKAARNSLIKYIAKTNKATFLSGKMIFLQGSPILTEVNGIKTGRLSGIVAHYVPAYLQANRLPTYDVNCIADWNTKVDAIVNETYNKDMRLFGGIPSWLLHYMETLLSKTNKKTLIELFPHMQLLVIGGTGYEAFSQKFKTVIGKEMDVVEIYPATEGFIAYQDQHPSQGLLLNTNAGIFFEFIAMEDFSGSTKKRIWLHEVELDKNYVIVLNTNSGLFGYVIGDTVKFVSKDPYRIIVTGRVKEYLSAFGEQVYVHQTDSALKATLNEMNAIVNEYHVYPQIKNNTSNHVWIIEFEKEAVDLLAFEKLLDTYMHKQNIYYNDIVKTGVISPLKIIPVKKNTFYKTMEKIGKAGEQNKIPRLSNNTTFAEKLLQQTTG